MYDDTILPVRTKFRVPSRSHTRVYFVESKTRDSLFFIKWITLVLGLLCMCFVIVAINITHIPPLHAAVIVAANSSGLLIILAEIVYSYIQRSLPLIGQILCSVINFLVFTMATVLIYRTENRHELLKTLLFLNGIAALLFLVDFTCRILISTYLFQSTGSKSVVDVGVNASFPPTGNKPKSPPHRSILTTMPITYGGTFPIGKDQPPFLAEERIPPSDGCHTPERGSRTRCVQTSSGYNMDSRGSPGLNYSLGGYSGEKTSKTKFVQTYFEHDEKGTVTVQPWNVERERRKKSPWTCSSPVITRKFDARKQATMSTPITYSGTFAVNKELVPITPGTITGLSPKSSPRREPNVFRTNTIDSRSAGNSPVRSENIFLELERLDQISEEKISQLSSENSSVKRSCTFCDSSILPGSVIEEDDRYRGLHYFA